MTSAHFVEPTGLSSGNVASSRRPGQTGAGVCRQPDDPRLLDLCRHTVTVNRRQLEFRNTNLLVTNPAWQVDVQKTGYIPEAGAVSSCRPSSTAARS